MGSLHRPRNDDLRRGGHPGGGKHYTRGGLAQAYPQVPPGILKLLQIMLGHELKELFDLLNFRIGERRTGFAGLFAFHAFSRSR